MSATDRHRRPTYSPEQLKQYFDRIGLPQKYHESAIIRKHESPDSETGLALLKTMQRYHLAAAPFENISLHYSTHRHISIEPHALFDKIVKRNAGRGGYCMENNGLFGTVLRSLGYDVYSVGARVNEAAEHRAASKNWTGFRFNGW
jgi:arylamine N-acetyltransferase